VHIQDEETVTHVGHISRVTTTGESPEEAPTSPPTSPEGSLEEENHVGHFAELSNVVHLDERIAALEAAEKRRKVK
jgi:hypothetical protein